ncbi:MAG: amidohydrolase family protein [Planctomycetota bacterium]|nr:amidohydrolase family protein [Planctomycetota bacterium]
MTDRYAAAAFAGKPIDFHFVMDTHAHLGQNFDFLILDASAKGMVRAKDRLGIDLTAVSSIPGTIGGWLRGNDQVIEAVQQFPDRILGYITINAYQPESVLKECERCWAGGCRALKLHTGQGMNYDHPAIRPALEFAQEKGCPILCHVWGAELDHMEPLIARYWRCNWILAHVGSARLDRYIEVARKFDNAWLETCVSWCPRGLFPYLVSQGLEDKIIWGSDADFYAASPCVWRGREPHVPRSR